MADVIRCLVAIKNMNSNGHRNHKAYKIENIKYINNNGKQLGNHYFAPETITFANSIVLNIYLCLESFNAELNY